jgi:hypothetical protein
MQSLGSRFVMACLFFWAGLHVVGFGMIANGSAQRGNPTWEFVGPLLGFEWMAVKSLAFAALAAAGIVVAYFALAAVLGLVPLVIEKWEQIRRNGVNDRPSTPLESDPVQKSLPDRDSWISEKTATQIPYATPFPAKREHERREIPRAPTPEELKKKAIRQIMGRK